MAEYGTRLLIAFSWEVCNTELEHLGVFNLLARM